MCLALCLPFLGRAQKTLQNLHTVDELADILDKSTLTYHFNLDMDERIECEEHMLLNDAFTYSKRTGDKAEEATYELSATGRRLMDSGEAHFMVHDFDSARFYYEKFTKLHPEVSTGWTYLAQTYIAKGDDKTAAKLLHKAIGLNYYDYLSHYLLAHQFLRTGDRQKALDEIVMASILDRNNPHNQRTMQQVFDTAGMDFRDFCFEPQIQFSTAGDGQINIVAGRNWMGYSLARAIWEFEPGYDDKFGPGDGAYELTEDRECLLTEAVILARDTSGGYQSEMPLAALVEAAKKDMFHDYLLYEVALPKHPSVVYQLRKSELEDLRRYVIAIRGRRRQQHH